MLYSTAVEKTTILVPDEAEVVEIAGKIILL